MGRGNPGPITNNDILDNPKRYFQITNAPSYLELPLIPDLKIGKDIKILNFGCAEFLYDIYGGTKILRRNKPNQNEKYISELYPFSLDVIILPNLPLFELPKKFAAHTILLDPTYAVQKVKAIISTDISPKYGLELQLQYFRLWKLDSKYDDSALRVALQKMDIKIDKYTKDQSNPLQESNFGVDFPGVSADFLGEAPIGKLFSDSRYLIIERASNNGEFIFRFHKKAKPGVCPACNIYKTLMTSCECGKVFAHIFVL